MSWFLDTNICIYLLKGAPPRLKEVLLSKRPADVKIPAMVAAELDTGIIRANRTGIRQTVDMFLSQFEIVNFDRECAEWFGVIRAALTRKETNVGPYDLIIAATVIAKGGILVTNNEKEFARVDGLIIENWAT